MGKSSSWLVVVLWIVFIAGILGAVAYGLYRLFLYMKRKGTCKFVKMTNSSTDSNDDMVQSGYIICTDSGPNWDRTIKVKNNGLGTFYIDSIHPNSFDKLEPNDSIEFRLGNQAPNIYYKSGSMYPDPDLTIIPE